MAKNLRANAVALAVVVVLTASCGSPDDEASGSPTPTVTTTAAPTTTTTTKPTTTTPPSPTRPPCGTAAKNDASGNSLPAGFVKEARAIHQAACDNDLKALRNYLNNEEGSVPLAGFKVDPEEGHLLATTLETKPRVGQGGLTYCAPNGAVAVIPRGVVSDETPHVAFWDTKSKIPSYMSDC